MIASAQTPEDLQAVADLIAEAERLQGSGASPARWVVKTLGEVATFFGVEGQTVREWRSGANPMPGEQGQWDLSVITQWRCDRLKALGANAKSAEEKEIELAILKEDLEKKRLANQMKSGALIDCDFAVGRIMEMNNEARVVIEGIPEKLSPMFDPVNRNELTAKATQEIALVLRHLSQKADRCLQ